MEFSIPWWISIAISKEKSNIAISNVHFDTTKIISHFRCTDNIFTYGICLEVFSIFSLDGILSKLFQNDVEIDMAKNQIFQM